MVVRDGNAWISRNATWCGLLNNEIPKVMPLLIHFVICINYRPISESIVGKQTENSDSFMMSWPQYKSVSKAPEGEAAAFYLYTHGTTDTVSPSGNTVVAFLSFQIPLPIKTAYAAYYLYGG